MIDIHCHLLPGIDDGSRSVEQSAEALQLFVDKGVRDVILTPHVTASRMARDLDAPVAKREAALEALRGVAVGGPQLHLGFEIMLDQPVTPLLMGDRRYSLAGSRYYLVEFPNSIVPKFAGKVLANIARAGVIPLVAHPERYNGCDPDTIAAWRDVGAKMQVDATELTRPTVRGRRARALLAAGLADLIAADNHGNRRVVTTGVEYLSERGAGDQARVLAVQNPAAVLQDGEMVAVAPIELKESLLGRWRRFVGG